MSSPSSVEVRLVFWFTYILFKKYYGSRSQKALRVPQWNQFIYVEILLSSCSICALGCLKMKKKEEEYREI